MEEDKDKIKIFQKGEDVLRKKAQEVPIDEITSEKFRNIIKKMEQAIAEDEDALAVAAPQIGESWQITVISKWALDPTSEKPKSEFENMVFINPQIINKSKDTKKFPEGCLSVPGDFGEVERAEKVKVEAYDENGKKFQRGASNILAQTLQHEIDHLNGILFVDNFFPKSDVGKR
ncbi:peptide deformylase [Patescibacteria group bacterium]